MPDLKILLSLYAEKQGVLGGCFLKIPQKIFSFLTLRIFARLIGGGIFRNFSKNFSCLHYTDIFLLFCSGVFQKKSFPRYTQKKVPFWGPLFSKKIHSLVIRRKRPHFGAPPSESFYKKKTSAVILRRLKLFLL